VVNLKQIQSLKKAVCLFVDHVSIIDHRMKGAAMTGVVVLLS
jgi:hypothetical protein